MVHKNSCISMLFHLYRHSCFISYCLLGPCPVTRPYPEFGAAPEARHPRPSDRACFAQCCPGAPLLGLWLKLSRRGHVLHCWYWQAWLVHVLHADRETDRFRHQQKHMRRWPERCSASFRWQQRVSHAAMHNCAARTHDSKGRLQPWVPARRCRTLKGGYSGEAASSTFSLIVNFWIVQHLSFTVGAPLVGVLVNC